MLYRLSHSINVPYEELIAVKFDDDTLEIAEGIGYPYWKLRSACLHYGQVITTDRVWLRDAVLDAMIQAQPKSKKNAKKELEDHFEICNLEIAHSKTKPRSEYIKRRREQLKKQKEDADIRRTD